MAGMQLTDWVWTLSFHNLFADVHATPQWIIEISLHKTYLTMVPKIETSFYTSVGKALEESIGQCEITLA